MLIPNLEKPLTGIWQAENPQERDWINESFQGVISTNIFDGKHEYVCDDCVLLDSWLHMYDPAYYQKFRGKNAYLIHFLDEFYEGGYEEIYSNFKGVFRGFDWAGLFNTEFVKPLPIGYLVGRGLNGRKLSTPAERKYIWSFAGDIDKSSRPDMARALLTVQPHYFLATGKPVGFHFMKDAEGNPPRLPQKEYTELLFDSVFAPCPMGNVNIESYRVYEALEAGAIPIVEKRATLDYYRELLGDHPMPTVRSWTQGRELMISLLDKPEALIEIQKECTEWWVRYKAQYRSEVIDFIVSRSASPIAQADPVLLRPYSSSLRMVQLLRHHSLGAVLRRIRRQATRLVRAKAWRVAPPMPKEYPKRNGVY